MLWCVQLGLAHLIPLSITIGVNIMLFNVWENSQPMKTTVIAFNAIAAKQIFATRYGWLSDMEGYSKFIERLNIEKVY